MSLVMINGKGPYQAIQVGTRRDGPLDDPFWLVFLPGVTKVGAPYEDWEVERVPAHRGEYDPKHWGERSPHIYDRYFWVSNHRKEGEAN